MFAYACACLPTSALYVVFPVQVRGRGSFDRLYEEIKYIIEIRAKQNYALELQLAYFVFVCSVQLFLALWYIGFLPNHTMKKLNSASTSSHLNSSPIIPQIRHLNF